MLFGCLLKMNEGADWPSLLKFLSKRLTEHIAPGPAPLISVGRSAGTAGGLHQSRPGSRLKATQTF